MGRNTSSSKYVWQFSSIFDHQGNLGPTTVHANLIGWFFQYSNHPFAARSNNFCIMRMVQKLMTGSKTRGGLLGLAILEGIRRVTNKHYKREVPNSSLFLLFGTKRYFLFGTYAIWHPFKLLFVTYAIWIQIFLFGPLHCEYFASLLPFSLFYTTFVPFSTYTHPTILHVECLGRL
jgi:hypothetical protein